MFSPGGMELPGRLPPVLLVNGLESETVWLNEKESTSRALPVTPFSFPISRWVNEYSTESRTMGRNGESTVSNRITRF